MSYPKRQSFFILFICVVFSAASCSNKKKASNKKDKTLSAGITAEGASLQKFTGDYNFDTAGSPLYMGGSIYFTNNNFDHPEQSRTMRMNMEGKIDTLLSDNGVTTTLIASGKGTIYACEMLGHKVVELDKTGKIMGEVANQYNGKRIDGPNDLVVDADGGVYFSDSQFIAGGEKKQETPAVYYIDSEKNIKRVIDDIEFPNGLGLSPDGLTLYVTNTNGKYLMAYNINKNGILSNGRKFAEPERPDNIEISGADGMTVDSQGNVYVATTKGLGIQVFDKEGKHLVNISCPSPTNNASFGGPDNKTLFISAQDGIYSIETTNRGL